MSDILCVTNRMLCREDFTTRLARIAAAGPHAIILREKDLSDEEYAVLAARVHEICTFWGVPLVLNGHAALAAQRGLPAQLSLAAVGEGRTLTGFGVSVHAPEEVRTACAQGACWLVAGHVWDTACKAGTPGRGAHFLGDTVRAAAGVPVYAIGGVTPERMPAVRAAGAAGACVMSALMTCPDPAAYLHALQNA